MTVIDRKRLQIQPVGQVGVDRWILFLSDDTSPAELRRYRGVTIMVRDRRDARRKWLSLQAAAEQAVLDGEVADFLDELDRRTKPATATGWRFGDFVDEWLVNCVEGGGLTESSIETDRSIVSNHLKPFFGEYRLAEIDARVIDQFKAQQRSTEQYRGPKYSNKSINNHLSVLRRVLEKAEEYQLIDRLPFTKRTWLRRDRTREDSRAYWTPAQEKRVFVVLDGWKVQHPERWAAIVTQLLLGLRFGELRALEKADLDVAASGVWVKRAIARRQVSTPKK